MVKSKKSKAKHQDFQKVKLKLGKKLPKGLNETTATFRTRAIVVKNQLKAETSQPVTKRRLNIQELFCQCQHYSTSVKQDALSGLRELTGDNPGLLHQHLPVLLERLAELVVDKEPLVRQAVLRLFQQVLNHISEDQLSPFFPVLSAYLSSAMTHIQEGIKRDSLKVLDLLLDHYPALVTARSHTLLSHFVDQISQQGQQRREGGATRMLLVNPSSQQSTMKWRRGVLWRLNKFLRALLGNMKHPKGKEASAMDVVVAEQTPTFCQPLAVWPTDRKRMFQYRLSTTRQTSKESLLHSSANLKRFMQTLVPLLLECWVEVTAARRLGEEPAINLTAESVSTLESVVEVLQLLLQCVHLQEDSQTTLEWVRKQHLAQFRQYFMQHFPFACDEVMRGQHKNTKKGKHRKKQGQPQFTNVEMSAVTLNLGICDIMTKLTSATLDASSSPWVSRLMNYCSHTLQTEKLSPEQTHTALDVAGCVLQVTSLTDVTSKLLGGIHHTFQMKLRSMKDVAIFLNFLERIVTQDIYAHLRHNPALDKWIEALPSLMGEKPETNRRIIALVRRVVSRGHPGLSRALQRQCHSIIGEGRMADCGRQWADLVYHIPHLDRQVLTTLGKLCLSGCLELSQLHYLLDVLRQRFQQHIACSSDVTDRSMEVESYISFLLTLTLGQAMTPGTDLSHDTACVNCGKVRVQYSSSQARQLCTQYRMSKRSCQDLEGMLNHSQILDACKDFALNSLEKQEEFPLRKAVGCVVLCGTLLCHQRAYAEGLEDGLTRICVCLHAINRQLCEQKDTSAETDDKDKLQKTCDLITQEVVTVTRGHLTVATRWVSIVTTDLHDWADRGCVEGALDSLSWLLQQASLRPALQACKQQLLQFQHKAAGTMKGSQLQKWAEFIYTVGQL